MQQVEDGDQPQQEEDEDDDGRILIPRQDNHQYHYNAAGADYPPDNNGKEIHNNANPQLEEGEEEGVYCVLCMFLFNKNIALHYRSNCLVICLMYIVESMMSLSDLQICIFIIILYYIDSIHM